MSEPPATNKRIAETDRTKMAKSSEKELMVSPAGAIVPQGIDQFASFAAEGFVEDATIKLGDPDKGNIGLYAGELLGPGADIELDEGGSMPTWLFHPLTRDAKGEIVPQENVIHNVISSAQVDQACKNAMARKQVKNCRIWVAVSFSHRGENRRGLPMNHFKFAAKEI
jgi:hypothetical protein